MRVRAGHAMATSLLPSPSRDLAQFQADERGLRADVSDKLEKVTRAIVTNVTGR